MTWLLPDIDDPTMAPFFAAAAQGELRIQACASCGRLRHPPRPVCPFCRSFDAEWFLMSGRATVWSFVVAHPPLLPAYAEMAPYNVVVVSLDDDPSIRLVGNIVASADAPINSVDPSTIAIGTPVEVEFPPPIDGVVLPRWRAATAGA
jgi:uncharacterized OB-fold protein